jgi:hypothetical protein
VANQIRLARLTDPETSRQAVESLSGVQRVRVAIVDTLAAFGVPMTDEEIYENLTYFVEVSPSGARTRRKELVQQGKVKDSGTRGRTKSGRQAVRWELSS